MSKSCNWTGSNITLIGYDGSYPLLLGILQTFFEIEDVCLKMIIGIRKSWRIWIGVD